MGDANEGEKPKLGSCRKPLFQEKVQLAYGIWQVAPDSLRKKAANMNINKRKKGVVQHVPRNTRHAASIHKSIHPMLHLFGRLCDMYLPPSSWIPYWIDDDAFHLKGIAAHVGKIEYDAMLTM